MKFKCTQENLAKALGVVSKAVSAKVSLPILGNILFTAKDGFLTLAASNLETSISVTLSASIEKEGMCAVPAKLFADFVFSLAQGAVAVSMERNVLKVESGASLAKFTCMAAEDFPALPSIKPSWIKIELAASTFGAGITNAVFCAASGDSRPTLTGVLLKKAGKDFTVVATDGFRLSETVLSLADDRGKDFSLLVPAKVAGEVARMFASSADPLKLTFGESENLAFFECGSTLVSARVLDGEFPDYKRIIPVSHVLVAHTNYTDLVSAVKVANVFAKESKEGSSLVQVALDPAGECTVSSFAQQTGEGSTKFSLSVDAKDKLTLSFNSRYLLDLFNNVKFDEVDIASSGEASPCVFKPVDLPNFLHLIMPVKLN